MRRSLLASLVGVILSCSPLDRPRYVASENVREYQTINAKLNMSNLPDEQRWSYDRLAYRLFKEGNTFEALDLYKRLGRIEGANGVEMIYKKAIKENLENAKHYKEILDLMRKKNFGKGRFVYDGAVAPKYGPAIPEGYRRSSSTITTTQQRN